MIILEEQEDVRRKHRSQNPNSGGLLRKLQETSEEFYD
jgi:hypothetical protein